MFKTIYSVSFSCTFGLILNRSTHFPFAWQRHFATKLYRTINILNMVHQKLYLWLRLKFVIILKENCNLYYSV